MWPFWVKRWGLWRRRGRIPSYFLALMAVEMPLNLLWIYSFATRIQTLLPLLLSPWLLHHPYPKQILRSNFIYLFRFSSIYINSLYSVWLPRNCGKTFCNSVNCHSSSNLFSDFHKFEFPVNIKYIFICFCFNWILENNLMILAFSSCNLYSEWLMDYFKKKKIEIVTIIDWWIIDSHVIEAELIVKLCSCLSESDCVTWRWWQRWVQCISTHSSTSGILFFFFPPLYIGFSIMRVRAH